MKNLLFKKDKEAKTVYRVLHLYERGVVLEASNKMLGLAAKTYIVALIAMTEEEGKCTGMIEHIPIEEVGFFIPEEVIEEAQVEDLVKQKSESLEINCKVCRSILVNRSKKGFVCINVNCIEFYKE